MSKKSEEQEHLSDRNHDIIKKLSDYPDYIKPNQLYKNIREGDDLIAIAAMQEMKIDKEDPIVYAIKNNFKIKDYSDGKFQDPVDYAISKRIKIEGKDPKEYQKDLRQKIGEEFEKNNTSAAKALTFLIDDFSKNLVTKEMSEYQIEKKFSEFYEKFLDVMEDNKIITHEQKNTIKFDNKDQREFESETAKLLKTNTPELTTKDKLCYKISNFCEKINLPKLSQYFMSKVKDENVTKIRNTEKAILKSLKIGAFLNDKLTSKDLVSENEKSIRSKLDKKISNKYSNAPRKPNKPNRPESGMQRF